MKCVIPSDRAIICTFQTLGVPFFSPENCLEMAINPALSQLIADMGQCIVDMDSDELKTFAQNWQLLCKNVDQPGSTYDEFLKQLTELVNQSPTLYNNAFGDVLTVVARYTPTVSSKPVTNPTKGLALIRNEVIRMEALILQIKNQRNIR